MLDKLLWETNYDTKKRQFLVNGFREGFDLGYKRPQNFVKRQFALNLKIRVGSKTELWNKIMNEVKLKRYAGPFADEPPFEEFIQSPIGLVPKDKGTKTRLIFHLSYPRSGHSVNSAIDKDLCSVKYPDFSQAIDLCLAAGAGCHVSKSDMSSAFRHVPMKVKSFLYLVLKVAHPETGVVYYFVDKCLPFGSSISCAIFQAFYDAVAYIVSKFTGKPIVNSF